MTLDDMAIAVLNLDPNDAAGLKAFQGMLDALPGLIKLPEPVQPLLEMARSLMATLTAGTSADPRAIVNDLNQVVAGIQEKLEEAEGGDEYTSTSLPGSMPADEKPAAPVSAAAPNGPVSAEKPTAPEALPPVQTEKPAAPTQAAPAPALETAEEGDNVSDADPEILGEFISETLEHLQNSEVSLLKLETDPGDQENLNNVFRAFHSTKGTSSFLGLNRIKTLAHHAEMLLDRARKGELQLTGLYADLAFESADMLKWMVEQLQDTSTGPVKPLPPKYNDLLRRLDNPGASKAETPTAQPAASPAVSAAVAAPQAAPGAPAQIVPMATAESQAENAEKTERTAIDPSAATSSSNALQANATVRVSTDKLDGLINMVGELVITHAMIAQQESARSENDRNSARNIAQLEKITRELQDLSMSLRMVPLKATFQKMERLVRDVAKKSQKTVQFKMEGEDTEIDRNMVETINDPLVHMLRNAVDHGIESPEIRRQAGKPEYGTVILRAYHTAGNIVIELHDDGKGLDRNRIFNKAVEKGLLDPDRELSDQDTFKLIFLPGFSTAEKVTEVSGRGVGLDVVKKNIESIRGRVDINSKPGQGTIFSMRIPLTLAIIDGMLLKVGPQQYLLPTLNVKQAFRPDPASLFKVAGRGEMVKLRERLIPIYRLHQLFRVQGAAEDPTQGLLLVVEHEGEVCALLADALLGQQQLVIKSLPAGVGKNSGSSGAAILGDGRISLILDVASILLLARGGSLAEAAR